MIERQLQRKTDTVDIKITMVDESLENSQWQTEDAYELINIWRSGQCLITQSLSMPQICQD